MQRFKNILVVVEDNCDADTNPAIARAAVLARRNEARLTLVDVVTTPSSAIKEYKGIISADELTELMVTQRKKELSKTCAALQEDKIFVTTKIATGRGFIEVIREVLQGGHDLVIKVADREHGLFGGSDFHLMRKCPCPVWIVKPGRVQNCRKILATVDLAMEAEDEGRALNALIMDLGTSLARWENAELHLLCCWELYGESALRHSAFLNVSEERIAALLDEEQAANQRRLDQLAGRYTGAAFDKHLIKGDPDTGIPDFVSRNGIDTVVMGTLGRSGIPGLLIGNTAETVLQSIDTSVITVKPSGFESPIR